VTTLVVDEDSGLVAIGSASVLNFHDDSGHSLPHSVIFPCARCQRTITSASGLTTIPLIYFNDGPHLRLLLYIVAVLKRVDVILTKQRCSSDF
jgi:hypothetical protein